MSKTHFGVAKKSERYITKSYLLKEDDKFIIFTSFLDACLKC